MRVKISFLRDQMSANTIPLHHQTLLAESLGKLLDQFSIDHSLINFSSLKGTSKIQNGFMRFLSSKVTLVLSSRQEELIEKLVVNKPLYRCQACGFAGRTLQWQCPACKRWDMIKPIPE